MNIHLRKFSTLFSYEAKGDSIFVNQAKNLVIYVNSIQK